MSAQPSDPITPLWDYGNPADSEQRFRALLPTLTDEDLQLQVLTQIARAQGLQRQFTAATATLDEVASRLPATPATAHVRYELERGRVLNSSGSPDQALPHFQRALGLAQQTGEDGLAVDAAHMIAIVSPPQEALAWNLQALEMAQTSDDPAAQRWQGSLLNNIGWSYHAARDYARAFTYLEQAREYRRRHGPEAEYRIARWCVARVRRDLGQTSQALAEQRALAAEYEALGEPSGYVFEEIGACLAAQGDAAAAAPYYARAYELLSADPWLVANEASRLARLKTLGESGNPA